MIIIITCRFFKRIVHFRECQAEAEILKHGVSGLVVWWAELTYMVRQYFLSAVDAVRSVNIWESGIKLLEGHRYDSQ